MLIAMQTPKPSKIVERLDFFVVDCVASESALVVVVGKTASSPPVGGAGAIKTVVRIVVVAVPEDVAAIMFMVE
jgi:hypothetical protein